MTLETMQTVVNWASWLGLAFAALATVAGGVRAYYAPRVEAERERLRIERTTQRSLTSDQREHLVSSLRSIRQGFFEIWYRVGDFESAAFAEQFSDVFGEIGWGRPTPQSDSSVPSGVTVRVHSKDGIPEFAARFVHAAGEIGVPVTVTEDTADSRLSDTRVYLMVGRKPVVPLK